MPYSNPTSPAAKASKRRRDARYRSAHAPRLAAKQAVIRSKRTIRTEKQLEATRRWRKKAVKAGYYRFGKGKQHKEVSINRTCAGYWMKYRQGEL